MIVHRLNISDQWFNAEEWRTLADIAYKARRYEHYQRCIDNAQLHENMARALEVLYRLHNRERTYLATLGRSSIRSPGQ
jgi:hypothetical protein